VFENRVLRRMFGPKRDEVTGGWRKFFKTYLRFLAVILGYGLHNQGFDSRQRQRIFLLSQSPDRL
jgi:hypothetical protein